MTQEQMSMLKNNNSRIKNYMVNILKWSTTAGILLGLPYLRYQNLKAKWEDNDNVIVGTVLEEYRGTHMQPNHSKLFSPEEEEYLYTLKISTEEKVIALTIKDFRDKTAHSLDALIDEGSKIGFKKGNLSSRPNYLMMYLPVPLKHLKKNDEETYFHDEVRYGSKGANNIYLLDKN